MRDFLFCLISFSFFCPTMICLSLCCCYYVQMNGFKAEDEEKTREEEEGAKKFVSMLVAVGKADRRKSLIMAHGSLVFVTFKTMSQIRCSYYYLPLLLLLLLLL